MKRTQSMLCLTLVVLLCLGASGALGEAKENTLPIANGDVTLTIYSPIQPGAAQVYTDYSQHPVTQVMMEETGINLKFIHPTGDSATFFNTTVASGMWPDIWHTSFNSYPGGPEGAMEDGVLLNINDLVAEYAPNYLSLIEKYGVEKQFISDTGTIINFGSVMRADFTVDKVFYGFYVRADLLRKHGLEMPYTYDEWDHMLSVFQQNGYPIPMAIPFRDGNLTTHSNLSAGLGVAHKGWSVGKDGQVVFAPIQPEYKDYLTLLNEWYAKKYFSSDSFGYSLNDTKDAMQADKVAVAYGHAAHTTTVKSIGMTLNPDFDVVGLPQPRRQKDDTVSLVYRNLRASAGNPWFVSATTPYPVECIRFMDYLYFESTQMLTAWGPGSKEYPTFDIVDGQRVFSDFMNKNPEGFDFQVARDRFTVNPFQVMYENGMEIQQYNYPEKLASIENFGYNATDEGLYPSFATLTVDESQELSQIMSQIDTYTSEMMEKFITGIAALDDFDQYVQQVQALNVERARQIKQDALDRYNAR